MTQFKGMEVYWPGNRDENGVNTFLLPGETEISGVEMRRRTEEYYKQIRRGRELGGTRTGFKAIEEARNLLSHAAAPSDHSELPPVDSYTRK